MKRNPFAVIGCACVCLSLLSGCGSSSSNYKKSLERQVFESEQAVAAQKKEIDDQIRKKYTTPSPAPTTTSKIPIKNEYEFTAGRYMINKDLPSGTYDMIWSSGLGNCILKDQKEDLISVSFFGDDPSWGQIKEYKNANLTDGGTIEVTQTLKIKFIKK